VPFFFATPAAWCTGRGEKVAKAPLGRPLDLVLVAPPVGLSTAEVYRHVTVPQTAEDGGAVLRALAAGDVEEVGRRLHNRLQAPAERLCPEVAALRHRLEELRPAGVLMSGSGSSLFALCRDPGEAQRVGRGLSDGPEEGSSPRVFIVRSCR
jgi:4-diphosphocytidyl-2-C-methyl-D-erythritol kinase